MNYGSIESAVRSMKSAFIDYQKTEEKTRQSISNEVNNPNLNKRKILNNLSQESEKMESTQRFMNDCFGELERFQNEWDNDLRKYDTKINEQQQEIKDLKAQLAQRDKELAEMKKQLTMMQATPQAQVESKTQSAGQKDANKEFQDRLKEARDKGRSLEGNDVTLSLKLTRSGVTVSGTSNSGARSYFTFNREFANFLLSQEAALEQRGFTLNKTPAPGLKLIGFTAPDEVALNKLISEFIG